MIDLISILTASYNLRSFHQVLHTAPAGNRPKQEIVFDDRLRGDIRAICNGQALQIGQTRLLRT